MQTGRRAGHFCLCVYMFTSELMCTCEGVRKGENVWVRVVCISLSAALNNGFFLTSFGFNMEKLLRMSSSRIKCCPPSGVISFLVRCLWESGVSSCVYELSAAWAKDNRTHSFGDGGTYLQDHTTVALSSLFTVPLTLGIWLGQRLSGN